MIYHFIYHWLYRDIWCVAYSNWVAGLVAGLVAYFSRGKAWLKNHKEHQDKIADIHKHLGLT